MIRIENKIIDTINEYSLIELCKHEISITNCIIRKLDLNSLLFQKKVLITNCIIQELNIYAAWFEAGLCFTNNIVKNLIDYQMGGHNKQTIEISNNLFHDFVSFFDCQFEAQLIVRDNIFSKGTDLFYTENKGFDNNFQEGVIAEGNIGKLDIINSQ